MASVEVSVGIGAMIVHVAAARGAAPAALAAAAGFDAASAADPDARIPLTVETRLWDEAARALGDDAFGVHAAEVVRPGAFDVMDYAVRTAPTLRVALDRLVRYNRLVHDAAVFSLKESHDTMRVEHGFRVAGLVQSRHAAEFTLASLLVIGGQIAGTGPLRARAVELRHPAPALATLGELVRVFGVEPTFSCSVNALELDRATLDRPAPAADPALWRVIERHAEALLAARPEVVPTTADRVRRALSSALGEGETTLAAVAAKLKMSERSLQRRLADEGVTFDALLDATRKDLALHYLADPRLAIGEVAYLLGYSEPSPFHRAFKRWTGITPSEARKKAA